MDVDDRDDTHTVVFCVTVMIFSQGLLDGRRGKLNHWPYETGFSTNQPKLIRRSWFYGRSGDLKSKSRMDDCISNGIRWRPFTGFPKDVVANIVALAISRSEGSAQSFTSKRKPTRTIADAAKITNGIHRTFATLDLTPEAIFDFARRYGFLGRNVGSLLSPDEFALENKRGPRRWPYNSAYESGECLSEWHYNITKVGTLLAIAEALKAAQHSRRRLLQDILAREASVPTYHDIKFCPTVITPSLENEAVQHDVIGIQQLGNRVCELAYIPSEGVVPIPYSAGHRIVAEFLGDESADFSGDSDDEPGYDLTDVCEMLLEHEISAAVSEGSRPTLERGKPLGLVPRDLLGCIYLSLALEVSGQSEAFRRCPSCGHWFEVLHDRQRYCEDKCKSRMYRQRKRNQDKEKQ